MSELVTSDYNEYEKLALKISNDTNYFDKIKNKIKQNKKNSNLFNTSVYTKNIEQTYQIIYSRNLKKELPENIEL